MLQHAACHRMAQRMCTTVLDSYAVVGISNNTMHGISADRSIVWGENTHKDCRVRGRRAFKAQIVHDRFASSYRHRQNIFPARLVMPYRYDSIVPVDISERELGNFAGA